MSTVTDYGTLRPTVVYNCHWMIALCQNARAYVGTGNGPWGFHYDRNRVRNEARRSSICVDGWANTHCPNGPTLDWYTGNDGGTTKFPPIQYCPKDPKRYGYHKLGKNNQDGTPKVYQAGVISSCDEFPPASWIQGGVQGGTGAKAICKCPPPAFSSPPFRQLELLGADTFSPLVLGAPMGTAKFSSTRKKLVSAWETEQDWQGDGFRAVGVSLVATWTNTSGLRIVNI